MYKIVFLLFILSIFCYKNSFAGAYIKEKNELLIILENLIALSIVALISSLVVSIFSTSIFYLNKFKTKQQMINIAKSQINNITEYNIDELYDESKIVDGYEVRSKFIKLIDYYNCYKVIILVKSKEDEIKIESYMVKS